MYIISLFTPSHFRFNAPSLTARCCANPYQFKYFVRNYFWFSFAGTQPERKTRGWYTSVCTPEALVRTYQTERCHKRVYHNAVVHRCDNFASCTERRRGGTRWCTWLRHWATNREVAGSIPNGVTGVFQWLNPSGRIVVLGSTQPVTEMSFRNPSWG